MGGGARVVLVNPYREPGMERYWVPSNLGSALFGVGMALYGYCPGTGVAATATSVSPMISTTGMIGRSPGRS